MKQMILKIDSDVSFEELNPEVQEIITSLRITWPEAKMVGTKSYYGKQLILILCPVDGDTLSQWLSDGFEKIDDTGESFKIDLGLNWSVVAEEGKPLDHDEILKYIEDDPDSGEPVTDITGKLQTWAGHKWTY